VVAEASTSSPSSSSSSSPDPCCRAAAIRREVSATAAASAGSPFAARLEAVYESEGDALLVLERCEGGDLRGLLQDRNGAPLDEASAAAVLRGVLHALAACHAQGMVYGDVKPGNVCLLRPRSAEDSSSSSSSSAADADAPINDTDLSFFGGVRLVDWGAASPAPLAPGALSGSPLYWAPEQAVGFAAAGAMLAGGGDGSGSGDEDGVIGGAPPQSAARGGYGPAVDVWAAGVLAYQLMSGRLPYWGAAASEGGGPPRGLRPWQLLAAIRTAPISAWPGASALARDLVVRCMLERDPARRITAAEALAHPFFAKHGLAGLEAKAAEPRAAPKRRQQKQQQQQKHQSAR
jgi:calcium-dependent protein kinase